MPCDCSGIIEGVDAALLKLGMRVEKATLDPRDPDDYVVIVSRLASALSRSTSAIESRVLQSAMDAMDVDWKVLSKTQIRKVIREASGMLNLIPSKVLPAVNETLTVAGNRISGRVRKFERRDLDLNIPVAMSLADQRMLGWLAHSQNLFITDEYGRRAAQYSNTARRIVSNALGEGLGTREISKQLQASLGAKAGLRRSAHYWDIIAGSFANRARVWGHLTSFSDAGVTTYVFESVLDERTSEICRFMHGKTLSVSAAMDAYRRAESAVEPEEVKDAMPWLREGRDSDGTPIIYGLQGGDKIPVATIREPGFGIKDGIGSYDQRVPDSRLEAMGMSIPPLHGRCRSTIVIE